MALQLRPHEEAFPVRPVGIRYICEFCNEGEMFVIHDRNGMMLPTSPPRVLIPHRCNKCGKEMELPRSYPYIEWEVISDDHHQ